MSELAKSLKSGSKRQNPALNLLYATMYIKPSSWRTYCQQGLEPADVEFGSQSGFSIQDYEDVSSWVVSEPDYVYAGAVHAVKTIPKPANVTTHTFAVGTKSITVPSELKFLEEVIADSTYMLELEQGWDGREGIPIRYATWEKACDFIVSYSEYVLANVNKVISAPDIVHSDKGSIDLIWRTSSFRLIVNVPEDDDNVSFYADDYKDQQVKGKINLAKVKIGLALTIADLF